MLPPVFALLAGAGGHKLRAIVCESRPLCEGVRLANALAEAGVECTLITDAQVGWSGLCGLVWAVWLLRGPWQAGAEQASKAGSRPWPRGAAALCPPTANERKDTEMYLKCCGTERD